MAHNIINNTVNYGERQTLFDVYKSQPTYPQKRKTLDFLYPAPVIIKEK